MTGSVYDILRQFVKEKATIFQFYSICQTEFSVSNSSFVCCLWCVWGKHQEEADELQGSGDPDRTVSKALAEDSTKGCTNCKNANDKIIMQAFLAKLRILRNMIFAEQGSGRTHIADAHGGSTGQSTEFSEGIDLHGTGEGKQDICWNVHRIGKKTDQNKQDDFTQ